MTSQHKHLTTSAADFWLARSAIVVVAVLQLSVVNDLTVGPRWLAPAIEFALLIPLSIGTAWTQRAASSAQTNLQWNSVGRDRRRVRMLAVALTAVVTMMNFGALFQLLHAMFGGQLGLGKTLLLDAVNIWLTNVVIFALWFWTIDRGGPAARGIVSESKSDFVFTQQQLAASRPEFQAWTPGFIDYLFIAFTNGTAFSPSDTFPLTARAKLLMMAEAGTSLITVALVAARAVGILT